MRVSEIEIIKSVGDRIEWKPRSLTSELNLALTEDVIIALFKYICYCSMGISPIHLLAIMYFFILLFLHHDVRIYDFCMGL